MKTQTNNSLFTNVEADNAANVNGGSFPDYTDAYCGFSTSASYFLFRDQLNRNGVAYHPDHGSVYNHPNFGLIANDPDYGWYQIDC